MALQQVLVSLQIESGEIRLLAGEFFSERLNILGKKNISCAGMDGIVITDKKVVSACISNAVNELSKEIGVPILSVILSIPSYRINISSVNSYQLPQGENHEVTIEDIKNIYREGNNYFVGNNREVINTICNSYKVDNIVYRKMPLGKKGDFIESVLQLLCVDKEMTYDYLDVVNKAGLKVMDIYVDALANAKEAALFEQSSSVNYILNIQLERQFIVFSLINDGKIVNCASVSQGYNSLLECIQKQYNVSFDKANNLLFRYGRVDETDLSSERTITKYSDSEGNEQVITCGRLNETISSASDMLVDNLIACCSNIFPLENLQVVISGGGAAINGIDRLLSQKINRAVRCYFPETIGARDSRWTVCLGLMYAYRDSDTVYQKNENSVDLDTFYQSITSQLTQNNRESAVEYIKQKTGKLFKHNESQED